VTDGEHLVVYFKSGLVACCDLEGNILWEKNLQDEYAQDTLWWDLGTSPVLSSKGVVIAVVQEGASYLITLDLKSGEVVWKQDRQYKTAQESDQSYTTPSVETVDGVETIVTWGADHLTGHDAATGKMLWECGGFNLQNEGMWRTIASATVVDGVAYVPFGRGAHLAAIKLGGEGDITGKNEIWRKSERSVAADVPCPIVADGKVYLLTDKGDVSCRNAETGEELWSDRLPRGSAPFFSSPLLADGKLYAVRENGTVYVCDVTDGMKLLAENEVGGPIVATPVPAGDSILIRTRTHLYRFGK
jgi:outer membrane protein assembly factor BamB